MADDGPQIVRPVPRRPFNTKLTTATPPSESSSPSSPAPEQQSSQLLFPESQQEEQPSLSRLQSFTNLTAPTLLGIYSPESPNSDRAFFDRGETSTPWGLTESNTPWGTGAQTPIKRPNLDDATYELMVDRSHLTRRRSSFREVENFGGSPQAPSVSSLTLRTSLLFLLGVGYGILVTHFHDEQGIGSLSTGIIRPGYNWKYLTFWGVAGALLGSLLPWFDGVWEESFERSSKGVATKEGEYSPKKEDASTDLALVVRAIGAFVGIAFAIRKLAWDSTMQASATLALVNPLLWWLIDRSLPGFLLSTAVGLTGSLFLLGVNPEMMPAPSTTPFRNSSIRAGADTEADFLTLGGIASQETVETGIWMLSVLFCSCICFGNIGRRLMK
ncbi:Protein NSG2 [Paramyrothecium foliicola]|nr:Protein NSG2 [Paramyrothecium foliicola]